MTERLLIGGHRGMGATDGANARRWRNAAEAIPENTAEALAQAFRRGADFIEFDVVPAQNGLVVTHNARLSDHVFPPPADARHTTQATTAALARLTVGHRGDPRDRMPSFEQALLAVRPHLLDGHSRFINVELKEVQDSGLPGSADGATAFVAEAHALVARHGLLPATLFSSFSADNLRALHAHDPQARLAMLFGTGTEDQGGPLHAHGGAERYCGFTPLNVHELLDELPLEALHPPLQAFADGGSAVHGVGATRSWAKRHDKPLPAINIWALNEEPVSRLLPLWECAHDLLLGFQVGFITDYPVELRNALVQRGRIRPAALTR